MTSPRSPHNLRIAMPSREAAPAKAAPVRLAPFNNVPLWSPRVWNGMQATAFGKLLAENRYKIALSRLPSAYVLVIATGMPSIVNRWQKWCYGKQIAETELVADPIFVLGHWRTGTTLLHELLTLDSRFASPTTFQCFMPRGFLVTQSWLRPLTARLLPERRPMDNMAMGWEAPQEDEFAMLSMGVPTPYRRMAFPNNTPRHLDYLNMNGIPHRELQTWKATMREFVGTLNYHYGKQIILKSPPHTGRISVLLDIFPNAKFVHIHRSPFEFIPSTMHMWAALDTANGFQLPHHQGLESYVFDCFDRVYRGYFRDQHLLTKENSFDVSYRELVARPVETMKRLYDTWHLGCFDSVAPKLRAWDEASRGYRKNTHRLDDAMRDKIEERCSKYLQEMGYSHELAAA